LARDQILGKVLSYKFVKRNATKRNKVRQQGKLLGGSHVYVLVGFHRLCNLSPWCETWSRSLFWIYFSV